MDRYVIHFDGSCWPNPGGTAAYGFTLAVNGEIVEAAHGVIGTGPKMSNNVAEFIAAARGLAWVRHAAPLPAHITVRGDSMLVIQIMSGKWRATQDKLYSDSYLLCDNLRRELVEAGHEIEFEWLPREQNQMCDNLSKEHLSSTKQTE